MKSLINHLFWIEELLPADFHMAPKHGGHTYFLDEKMILILVEHKDRVYEHKGVTYPFDLWRGCIFPIEQKKQNAFFLKYLFLENHPVNKDWLYIPAESENFEEEVKLMFREITKRNPLLGIPLKSRMPTAKKATPIDSTKKPNKKRTAKAIKADKKRENTFILNMVKRERN